MLKRLLTLCAVAVMSLGAFAAVVEDFKKDWSQETGYPYHKVDGNATYEIEDGALKVTYPQNEDGSQAWSQYFIGDWMNLTEGYTYTIKFYAKSEVACTVDVLLGSWGSTGKAAGVAIGTEWSEVTCTVKDGVPTSTGNDLHVLIQGGLGPIYYQWVTVSHDDSEEVVKEPEPEPWVCPAGEVDFSTLPVVGSLLANNLGKKLNGGDVVWGSQSDGSNYVDVTAYQSVKFYGTAGMPLRLFVNRNGGEGLTVGEKEQQVTINEEGWVALDVKAAMAATSADYCHLSCVKVNWGASAATVDGISVIPAATVELPELTINSTYNEDQSAWTGVVEALTEGNTLLYTTEGDAEDPEYMAVEGAIKLAYTPGNVDEFGICKYIVVVVEKDAEGNTVAQGVEEVSLAKPLAKIDVVTNYNDDNSAVKVFAYPVTEGNMVLYAFENDTEQIEGEVPATGLDLAWTPGNVDEAGFTKYTLYLFEVDEEFNVLETAMEEITLAKAIEPLAGASAEAPVVLAEGWSDAVAPEAVGADEAGYAHFQYTAEIAGTFVFSCGYEIKLIEGLEAVEAPAGVRYAYGKEVEAGEVVTFSAYLPQSFVGVDDELYDVESYMFYAGVEAPASEPEPVAAGDYYIKHTATGQFLNGANAWGTKASLTAVGQLMTLALQENGTYTIDSHISNGGASHFLAAGDNTYVDAAAANHTIEALEDGTFAIKDQNGNYLAAADGFVNFNAPDVTDAAKWVFISRDMLIGSMAEATAENPVDVSSLIYDQNFSRNNQYFSAWVAEEGTAPSKGGDNTNMNAEKWGGNSQTFNVSQTLTDLPNGTYVLTVQGYYRYNNTSDNTNDVAAAAHADGTEVIYSVFYANEVEKAFKSIADEASVELNGGKMPFSQGEASAAFGKGAYTESLTVTVTDGTLKIGVKKTEHIGCDWTVWDNFTLTYLGAPVVLPELTMDYVIAADMTSATFTVEPTAEGSTVLYFIDDLEEAAGMVEEGNTFTVAAAPEQIGEQGVAHIVVYVREYDADMNVIAENGVEIDLVAPKAAVATDTKYNEDNSQCTLFAHPTVEGNMVVYAFEDDLDAVEGAIPAEGYTFAYTPGMADESGVCKYTIYLFEVDAEMNVVATGVEEISLAKPYEPMDGESALAPIVLATGWSEAIDAKEIGADEAGFTHFRYVAEEDGMFVFSCGNEIKKFGKDSNMKAVESHSVRNAYGKKVTKDEVITFSAYLPQSFEGIAYDEEGNEIEGETELYGIDEYTFYAGVDPEATMPGTIITEQLPVVGGSGEGSELAIEVLEADEADQPLAVKYTITNGTWGNNASHLSLFKYAPLSADMIKDYDKIVVNFAEPVPASNGDPTYGFIPVGFVCPAGWAKMEGKTSFEIVFTEDQKQKGIEDFSIFFNADGDLKTTELTITGIYLVKEVAPETPAEPVEMAINGIYNEDLSVWTANVSPVVDDANDIYYSLNGGDDEPEFQLFEGMVTLTWLEGKADEFGVCKYEVLFQEVDAAGNVVAQGFEEVSLVKAAPAIAINVNYSDDYSQAKLFAYPSSEDNTVVYAWDEEPEVFEGEVPATGLELAYTPGKVDESGVCKLVVYLFEIDAEGNVVIATTEEVSLVAPREPLAGDSDEEPIVLATGWSEPIAKDACGSDEAGYTHFQYTAEVAGTFVFSCNYPCTFGDEDGMEPLDAASVGVTNAYGKAVEAGDVVTFSAYLPGAYIGVAYDEEGNEIEGETAMYPLETLMFYADVIAEATVPEELALSKEMFCEWDGFGADANVVTEGIGACDWGVSTGLPYGDGNVAGRCYADLSAYKTLVLTVTEGTPRLLLNRQGMDNSGDFIEINNENSPYVKVVKNEDNTVWFIDLAKITEEAGYCHLNCIKGANRANTTITEALLLMVDVDTAVGINGVAANNVANDVIYDLAGRRVSKAVKGGLYIVNGKKVVLK